jgi:MoxR-like ATPase
VFVADFSKRFDALAGAVSQILVGKPEVVRQSLLCLFAGGHLLVEDVPGVGKTSLARAIAGAVDASWHRIQFTPDLLPSDVTGVTIYNQSAHTFEFHPGGIFANIVIADEINRASPKTQSALLEVIEERRVTVDAKPYDVPTPFMVVATQNPIEMDGTYRLPEAQLDRFLLRTSIGYPSAADEVAILTGRNNSADIDAMSAVMGLDELRSMIRFAGDIYGAPAILDYIVRLAAATRESTDVVLGASPRASVALLRVSRAAAAAAGRDFITPDDIRPLVPSVFAHRMVLSSTGLQRRATIDDVLAQIVASVAVPRSAKP